MIVKKQQEAAAGAASDQEAKRRAQEKRFAEEKSAALERQKGEEAQRLAGEEEKTKEEKRLSEEKRNAEEKSAALEQRKTEDEKRLAREKELADERRLAAEKVIAGKREKAEEAKRVAQEKRLAREKEKTDQAQRIGEEKRRSIEQQKREGMARLAEEKRVAQEKQRGDEAKRLELLRSKQQEIEQIAELYTDAVEFYDKGDYDAAVKIFKQIIEKDPNQEKAKEYLQVKIPAKRKKIEDEEKREAQERRKKEAEEKSRVEVSRKHEEELKALAGEVQRLKTEKEELEKKRAGEASQKQRSVSEDHAGTRRQEQENVPAPAPAEKPRKAAPEDGKVSAAISPDDAAKLTVPKDTYTEEYHVKPFDTIAVKVYQEEGLSADYKVQKGGFIDMPLLRKVQVEGLTVYEIEEKVGSLLAKDYIVDPQVMISVKEFHAEKIIILGQVVKPGTYELSTEEPITLLRAVSMAGGFTNIAAINNVKIVRLEHGKKVTMPIKANEIIDGKKEDIPLQPGDMVVVPESFW